MKSTRKIVVIGGGIAGLCAGVYARRCGYDVELLEQHQKVGGLATSWQRGDYIFENCLHWLLGSRCDGDLHAEWREVCDIDSLRFVDHEELVRLEDEHGNRLIVHTDPDLLEAELRAISPQDDEQIRHFVAAVRQLADVPMPPISEPWPARYAALLKMLPDLPLLWRLSHLTADAYGERFTHPLLRAFFQNGATGNLSVLALVLSLAWMSNRNAGYAIGGSAALIGRIGQRFESVGGRIRLGARVSKILIEEDIATGVKLDSGEVIAAAHIISAADVHATLCNLIGSDYRSPEFEKAFAKYEPFPSYVQVSLGIARNLSGQPGFLTLLLDTPVEVDPNTFLPTLSYRIFNFDPTFAPEGKTAVTCHMPTRNVDWWCELRRLDEQGYAREKRRVADAAIAVLGRRLNGIQTAIETVDVATPASVVRYTGNWKGSMEGWLITPQTGLGSLPQKVPGLKRFNMVGQWIQPGGGLPSGLMTARAAVQAICSEDRVRFL